MKLKKLNIWIELLIFTAIIELVLACYSLYSKQYSQAFLAFSMGLIPTYAIFDKTSKKDK
jgi:hypothetical protein